MFFPRADRLPGHLLPKRLPSSFSLVANQSNFINSGCYTRISIYLWKMFVQKNYPLEKLNTFNIKVDADYFAEVASISELSAVSEFISQNKVSFLILGGGSNILFTQNFKGLVVKVNLKGIEVLTENDNHIYVKAGAGVEWDDFVEYCVDHNWGGIENLSLIPGSVGASPVQNIGAYGVEMKDCFYELEYYNLEKKEIQIFRFDDCNFGYRYSIFKNELKNKGIVLSVTFKLNKKPEFKTTYGSIQNELDKSGVTTLSLKTIRDVVISIRRGKLPEPEDIPNAGSFFKNPVIGEKQFLSLQTKFPNIVNYKQNDGLVKLAAGWLIDQCGWKGKTMGNVGVHKNQALVLINLGNASGKEVYNLSEKIKLSVIQKFGVELEKKKKVIVSVINDLVTDQRVEKTCLLLTEMGYNVLQVGRIKRDSLPMPKKPYLTKRMKLIFEKGPFFYAEYNIRLFLLLLFRKSSLLVSNDLDTLWPNYLIHKLKNIPIVYDSHELFTETPEVIHRKFVKSTWEKIEGKIFPKLKDVITVCDSIAEIFKKKYSVDVQVVRNIPPKRSIKNPKTRQELNLPTDKKILILQGSGINIQRGAEELVDAMQYLSDNHLLLIIGGGDVIENLKNQATDLELNNIKFLPKQQIEGLINFTRNADLGLTLDKDTNLNYRYSQNYNHQTGKFESPFFQDYNIPIHKSNLSSPLHKHQYFEQDWLQHFQGLVTNSQFLPNYDRHNIPQNHPTLHQLLL